MQTERRTDRQRETERSRKWDRQRIDRSIDRHTGKMSETEKKRGEGHEL